MKIIFPFVLFLADFLERPLSSEMVIFYITQDTQRHPLLPELKSGLSIIVSFLSCFYLILVYFLFSFHFLVGIFAYKPIEESIA